MKILAHVLLAIWLGLKVSISIFFTSGINQYVFIGVVFVVWLLANAWIALLPEYDYRGNP
jgi:hypothetical protein